MNSIRAAVLGTALASLVLVPAFAFAQTQDAKKTQQPASQQTAPAASTTGTPSAKPVQAKQDATPQKQNSEQAKKVKMTKKDRDSAHAEKAKDKRAEKSTAGATQTAKPTEPAAANSQR